MIRPRLRAFGMDSIWSSVRESRSSVSINRSRPACSPRATTRRTNETREIAPVRSNFFKVPNGTPDRAASPAWVKLRASRRDFSRFGRHGNQRRLRDRRAEAEREGEGEQPEGAALLGHSLRQRLAQWEEPALQTLYEQSQPDDDAHQPHRHAGRIGKRLSHHDHLEEDDHRDDREQIANGAQDALRHSQRETQQTTLLARGCTIRSGWGRVKRQDRVGRMNQGR